MRERRARHRRDRRARARGGLAVSVVAPEGFAACGRPRRHQAAGTPDCAVVACTTARRGVRGRRLHDEPRRGRARHGVEGPPRRDGRTRPGDRRHLGQRQRGDRRARARRAPRPCARAVAAACGATHRRGARRPDRAHRRARSTFEAVAPAVAALCAAAGRRPARTAAAADRDPHHRLGAEDLRRAPTAASGWGRWRRARRCSRRTSPRCWRSSRPTRACDPGALARAARATRSRLVQPGPRRRGHLHQRHGVRPRLGARGTRARRAARRGPSARRAPRSRARWSTTPRARRGPRRSRCAGAASDHEAHARRAAVAGSLLVKCSLNGSDPYWGRVVAELGAAGVAFELDRGDRALRRRRGVRRRRGGVAHDADRRRRAPLGPPRRARLRPRHGQR